MSNSARILKLIRDVRKSLEKRDEEVDEQLSNLKDNQDMIFEFVEMFFFLFSRATSEGVFLRDNPQETFAEFVRLEEEYFATLSVVSFIKKLR